MCLIQFMLNTKKKLLKMFYINSNVERQIVFYNEQVIVCK